MTQANLYNALRAGFPADLQAIAIETDDGLAYSWSDLERGSAMLANWIDSLQLPAASRMAVQVGGVCSSAIQRGEQNCVSVGDAVCGDLG